MKVIYDKPIHERLTVAINEAQRLNKPIIRIEITQEEVRQLYREHCFADRAPNACGYVSLTDFLQSTFTFMGVDITWPK